MRHKSHPNKKEGSSKLTICIAVIGCLLGIFNSSWTVWQHYDQRNTEEKEKNEILSVHVGFGFEEGCAKLNFAISNDGKVPLSIGNASLRATSPQFPNWFREFEITPQTSESKIESGGVLKCSATIPFREIEELVKDGITNLVCEVSTYRGTEKKTDNLLPMIKWMDIFKSPMNWDKQIILHANQGLPIPVTEDFLNFINEIRSLRASTAESPIPIVLTNTGTNIEATWPVGMSFPTNRLDGVLSKCDRHFLEWLKLRDSQNNVATNMEH